MYIKHKTLENSMLFQELIEQQGASDNNMPVNQFDNFEYENTYEFIKSFEETLTAKKKKRKKGVENFIEEEGVSKAALEEDDIK